MKCINCHKQVLSNKVFVTKKGFSYVVCSDKCNEHVKKYLEKEKKWKYKFITIYAILIIITLILCLSTKNEIYSNIATIGIASFNLIFPIPTHLTIYIFGLNISKIMVRIVVTMVMIVNFYVTVC